MQSKAATVDEYLAQLTPDRRAAISAVRKVILANLDKKGYAEGMQYGMIGYAVPHSVFPAGYHCDPKQPLMFAALASQKNYMSIYMMGLYLDAAGKDGNELLRWFNEAWKKSGKKLDMGKACIRFKSLDELPLDVIGEAIRRVPAKKYVETYLRIRAAPRMSRAEIQAMVKEREAKKSSAAGQKKSAAKKTSEGKRPAPKKAVKKAAR